MGQESKKGELVGAYLKGGVTLRELVAESMGYQDYHINVSTFLGRVTDYFLKNTEKTQRASVTPRCTISYVSHNTAGQARDKPGTSPEQAITE